MTSKAWKDFEDLVVVIQRALSPSDAVVTPNDYIRDQVTGRLREVDASIRFEIDGTPQLVTVECRDRVEIEDSLWIEQLVTKQRDIGADRTVAVSSSGFYGAAVQKAEHHGILLRRIDKITIEDIRTWCLLTHVTIEQVSHGIENILITAAEDCSTTEIDPRLVAVAPGQLDINAPIIYHLGSETPYSAKRLVQIIEDNGKLPLTTDMDSLDGHVRNVTVIFEPNRAYIQTIEGAKWVQRVWIQVRSKRETIPTPITRVVTAVTPTDRNNSTTLSHLLEWDLPDGGHMFFHREEETGRITVTLRQPNISDPASERPVSSDKSAL